MGARLGALIVKGDRDTPLWFNEFTVGGGGYFGRPQVAIAYAFDNAIAATTPGHSATVRQYRTLAHQNQVQEAFEPF